jgi:hypothetical protein
VRDDKRCGRGAALAVIEASSRVQGPSLATVALEGETYTGKRCSVSQYRSGASEERGKPPCK